VKIIKLVTPRTYDDIFRGLLALRDELKTYIVLLHHCLVGSMYFDQLRTETVNTPSSTDVATPSGPVRSY